MGMSLRWELRRLIDQRIRAVRHAWLQSRWALGLVVSGSLRLRSWFVPTDDPYDNYPYVRANNDEEDLYLTYCTENGLRRRLGAPTSKFEAEK